MIPKVIHYCWFGGNPLPDAARKCIASWRRFFPEYEIKEWNEKNFDVNCCDYVREAYEAKKWAFVSDYARFWVLYNEGGLYFDTDVEVIKPFDDIINKGAFMGCETVDECAPGLGLAANPGLGLAANPGLGLAANPGLGLYNEILNYYEKMHFFYENRKIETVVDHVTSILRKHGWSGGNEIERIESINIYPPEYFCPMDYITGKLNITENTHSIHWYRASWQSFYSRLKTKIKHLLGEEITEAILRAKKEK